MELVTEVRCNIYVMHLALITNVHRPFYIDSWSCFKYFKSWIISELEICLFLKTEFPNHLDHLKLGLFHLTGKKMINIGFISFFLPSPHISVTLSLDGVWPAVENEISVWPYHPECAPVAPNLGSQVGSDLESTWVGQWDLFQNWFQDPRLSEVHLWVCTVGYYPQIAS